MIQAGRKGGEPGRLDRWAEARIDGEPDLVTGIHERPCQRDHRVEVPEPHDAGEQDPHGRLSTAEAYCIG